MTSSKTELLPVGASSGTGPAVAPFSTRALVIMSLPFQVRRENSRVLREVFASVHLPYSRRASGSQGTGSSPRRDSELGAVRRDLTPPELDPVGVVSVRVGFGATSRRNETRRRELGKLGAQLHDRCALELYVVPQLLDALVRSFTAGGLRLSEGVLCEWSAEEGEPMRYGWARVTSSEVSQLSAWLLEEGLEKQDADGETLFTDPDTGETYLVTDAEELRYSSTLDGARAVQAPA